MSFKYRKITRAYVEPKLVPKLILSTVAAQLLKFTDMLAVEVKDGILNTATPETIEATNLYASSLVVSEHKMPKGIRYTLNVIPNMVSYAVLSEYGSVFLEKPARPVWRTVWANFQPVVGIIPKMLTAQIGQTLYSTSGKTL